jgi:hypothetical protein
VKSKSLLGASALVVLASLALSTTALAQDPAQTDSPPRKEDAPAPKETDSAHHDGGVHFGVLGGVGFPRPLAVEGVLQFDRLILLGAEYSALPTTNFSGVEVSMWALAADARVFPMRNGFFVGLRVGKQHLGEQASITLANVGTLSAMNTADTTFINPRLGFLWNWHALAIGIDAGVQIPMLTTTASTLPAGVSAPSSATDLTHTFSQSVLPTVDLLRIGVVM